MTSSPKTIILYHAECPDGFTAAWAAWKKFGDFAEYIPVYHQAPPPDGLDGNNVFVLDYSYPEDATRSMMERTRSWTIIDHHPTNELLARSLAGSLFDELHSGAALAWSYFHPDTPTPMLVRYVEDTDIWKFALPESAAASEAIGLVEQTFFNWDALADDFEDESRRAAHIRDGRVLCVATKRRVAKVVESAETIEFEGYRCLMANSQNFVSDVGNALAHKLPPIGIVWSRRKNRIIVSLRSDGTADVSKLAQKYGGGGLKTAAAFSWEAEKFLDFRHPQ